MSVFSSIAPRLMAAGILFFFASLLPAADTTVYADALDAGWQNWSWSTATNFGTTSPHHGGANSVAVTHQAGYAGFYLHSNSDLSAAGYSSIQFWIHGGSSGGQQIRLAMIVAGGSEAPLSVDLAPPAANGWTQVTIPLTNFGAATTIAGFYWIDRSGSAQPAYYLDDIVLVESNVPPVPITLTVDVAAGRKPILPQIYGVSFADPAMVGGIGIPLRRWGGNSTTRYNYLFDTHNTASDYYFENIPDDNVNPAALPNDSAADTFVHETLLNGADAIVTVPLIGWTPKSRGWDCAFSIAKYGPQQDHEFWRPDCGNGYHTDGTPITGNDPLDTSVAINEAFVSGWINHLKSVFGASNAGGVKFYALDNEPMLWNSTHRDVHPLGASYDEVFTRGRDYASAIKATDADAQTLGPVLWGWSAYFYSAKDVTDGGVAWWNTRPDRMAHGDMPFLPWYLQQMNAASITAGKRLLDYVDIHFYPQGNGVFAPSEGSAATKALRLRSTRALWDATYTDESWIGEPVNLIPRMKAWIASYYPGTKLAITEYNFGAMNSLNGALAQADALGIFGREGADMACLWDPPTTAQPGAFAFRMFLNYDGAGAQFGDTSVNALSSDQSQLSVYAAQRTSNSQLTILVINKTTGDISCDLALQNFTAGSTVKVHRYSAANLASIVTQPDATAAGGSIGTTYPAESLTLLVVTPNSNVEGWATF
ncbi:glycoside hydrolase family 44 protein [Candidatus Sumerlaeota bacterium]|nr:glycoside hydrolase family 44 protein [Candidatus Sumerlaeota bacterium]